MSFGQVQLFGVSRRGEKSLFVEPLLGLGYVLRYGDLGTWDGVILRGLGVVFSGLLSLFIFVF